MDSKAKEGPKAKAFGRIEDSEANPPRCRKRASTRAPLGAGSGFKVVLLVGGFQNCCSVEVEGWKVVPINAVARQAVLRRGMSEKVSQSETPVKKLPQAPTTLVWSKDLQGHQVRRKGSDGFLRG